MTTGPGPVMSLSLPAERAAGWGGGEGFSAGTAGGRPPPRSPQGLRQAAYGAHRDSTLLVRSVPQSVSQKHFTHIISLILQPLTIVL